MLSEYYKFHKDAPTWNDYRVEQIMEKYYHRMKDVDYKRMKQILKKEQDISLTSRKSFSSCDDSYGDKKSKYSSILSCLKNDN